MSTFCVTALFTLYYYVPVNVNLMIKTQGILTDSIIDCQNHLPHLFHYQNLLQILTLRGIFIAFTKSESNHKMSVQKITSKYRWWVMRMLSECPELPGGWTFPFTGALLCDVVP